MTAASGPMWDRARCEEVLAKVAKLSRAEDWNARLDGSASGFTRFAVGTVTTAGDVEDVTLSIWSAFGKRSASVSTNRLDEASVEAAVRRCEELARIAPENPEMMPSLGAQSYLACRTFHEETATMGAAERAKPIGVAMDLARERGLQVAGFAEHAASFVAIRSKNGLSAYNTETTAGWSTTYRTPDGSGSGRAAREARHFPDLEPEILSRRAADKAALSKSPVRLDPGAYTVVLEPDAFFALMTFALFDLNARDADEGRSFFSKEGGGTKQGTKVFGDNLTVVSDPVRLGGAPFDGNGLAAGPCTWIENGIVKTLIYDRYWASQKGVAPTAFPTSIEVKGGQGSADDLVKGVERGILVTRFWYTNYVDPQTLLVTGLTRDGTFLIEKGKIGKPVHNFRILESVAALLGNIEALGASVRVDGFSGTALIPPVRVRDFHMESVSEAV